VSDPKQTIKTGAQEDPFHVTCLGERGVSSPLRLAPKYREGMPSFVSDQTRILLNIEFQAGQLPPCAEAFEMAGPRANIFFHPARTKVGIVTCGGLCPGLNNVIRSAFLEFYYNYGVREIWGIRYGYAGLDPRNGIPPVRLNEEMVDAIQNDGGTLLGSSRERVDPAVMTDFLIQEKFDILLTVGGDGTMRGAVALTEEIQKRGIKIAVVGVPKTIDNDIPYVDPSFGFSTAVARARNILDSAHAEAKGAPYGIGLVKLMGREAGFVAAGATLASQQVNFCLVPEQRLVLEGDRGFLAVLHRRMLEHKHAVIALAEGAGQDLFGDTPREFDASGNVKLSDVGALLRTRIVPYMEKQGLKVNLKYFEPSYYIRSVPANATDALLCDRLARYAVDAAMAGKTGVLIGYWNNKFVHVPMRAVVGQKRRLKLDSDLWRSVLASTGQPCTFEPLG
jgi:6-phosphofructokinase 1